MTRRQTDKGASPRLARGDGMDPVPRAGSAPRTGAVAVGGKAAPQRRLDGADGNDVARLERQVAELTAECDALRKRCQQLEETTAQVQDRIAWAIDSVESVLHSKG